MSVLDGILIFGLLGSLAVNLGMAYIWRLHLRRHTPLSAAMVEWMNIVDDHMGKDGHGI